MAVNLLRNPPESWRMSIRQLMSAWDAGRFPQAVLLDGPAGIGKKQLAMDLMAFLSCEDSANRACGHCFSCKMAYDVGASDQWLLPLALDGEDRKKPDKVREATTESLRRFQQNPFHLGIFEPTAFISVPQVRMLWDRTSLKASGVRVFVIAEADTMNVNAANALLKTLEEVPPQTYFILTTSQRHSLLQTIQSRSLPLRLPGLAPNEIAEVLQAQGHASPGPDLLGLSMGSVGKVLQCLEMDLVTTQKRAVEFLELLAERQWSRLFRAMDSWLGKDMSQALFFLEVLSVLVEDLSRAQSGAPVRFPSCFPTSLASMTGDVVARHVLLLSQTTNRIVDRKGSVSVCLQTMALQMGEA